MGSSVVLPPEGQLRPLLEGYARAVAARRRAWAGAGVVFLLLLLLAGLGAEVRPGVFAERIGAFGSYFGRLMLLDTGEHVWTDLPGWFWGLRRWSLLLGQTVLIAYAGTATGALLAVVGAVLASRNLHRSRVLRLAAVRVMEFGRTVPDLVFALLFVVAFGLGPLPGALALTLHTAGALGKLFAEVVEAAEMGPVEALRASGGTFVQQVRFAVLPQVMPSFVSYALLRFEINVRGAAVIGFVGAGGIGQELITAIRKFYYADTSAILLMLLVCVVAIGDGSAVLRQRAIAGAGGRRAGTRSAVGTAIGAGAVLALVASWVAMGISPVRLWNGLGALADMALMMVPPSTGGHLGTYLEALEQTLSIALVGTVAAGVAALPFGFLAARNVVGSRVLRLLARRGLDTVRSIDVLIWALIWIGVVGLGPFAGALAIACSDFGALAKLMSEAVETADRRPVDGVLACGGGRLAAIRLGILPQVLPVFASQLLYFFESNTRSATVIGIVGAGGIGLHLFEQIRVLEWQQVSFLILMVLVTVAVIDAASRRIRGAILGQ